MKRMTWRKRARKSLYRSRQRMGKKEWRDAKLLQHKHHCTVRFLLQHEKTMKDIGDFMVGVGEASHC